MCVCVCVLYPFFYGCILLWINAFPEYLLRVIFSWKWNIFQILSSSWKDASSNSLINDSSSGPSGEAGLSYGEDDENMVSASKNEPRPGYQLDYLAVNSTTDKHLRYRTRIFAAEYVWLFLSVIIIFSKELK